MFAAHGGSRLEMAMTWLDGYGATTAAVAERQKGIIDGGNCAARGVHIVTDQIAGTTGFTGTAAAVAAIYKVTL